MRNILPKSGGTHLAVIVLVSGILTSPFILFGASAQSDDALDHARWLKDFSDQFWSGVLYPRWLPEMNIGLGSPAFYYYPPLPYWLTSLLNPFFPGDTGAWHSLGISAALAVALSGVFAYLWLRRVADSRGALAGTLLYIAGPYHLASDAYVRFAFAELWSFVWMPLILYFVHRYAAGYKGSLVGVTLAYASLVMTHLPTTLIFSLCLLPYGFVLIRRAGRLDVFAFTGALLLGVGIGAIYLYPAMAMQPNVFLDRMTIGYFSYENWLLPSSLGLWTEDKIVIGLLVLDLWLLSVATFVVGCDRSVERNTRIFWLGAATFGFLMMTDLSRPIWWVLTPLRKVQFPFRFGTIMTTAVTALVAIAFTRAVRRSDGLGWRIASALLIAVWLPGTIWAVASVWQGFHPEADRLTAMNGTPDMPEYRPRQNEFMRNIDWETSVDENYWDQQMNADFLSSIQAHGLTRDTGTRARVAAGDGTIEVKAWKAGKIVLGVSAGSDVVVEAGQFYFPTWSASVDGHSSGELGPMAPNGLLALQVPSGEHEVCFSIEKGPEERIGAIISGVSLAVLLLVGVVFYRSSSPRTAS